MLQGRVRVPWHSVDLTHQIKSNEKPAGRIRGWVPDECGPGPRALRDDAARTVGKSQGESMVIQPLLDAEGISRTMDPEFGAIDQCGNDLSNEGHRRANVQRASHAQRKGVDAGKRRGRLPQLSRLRDEPAILQVECGNKI